MMAADRQKEAAVTVNPAAAAAAWAALAPPSFGAERHQAGLSARSHRVCEQTRHLISLLVFVKHDNIQAI